jgi:hypothetical protein
VETGCVENSRLLVLVVEDEFVIQELVKDALTEGGFEEPQTPSSFSRTILQNIARC